MTAIIPKNRIGEKETETIRKPFVYFPTFRQTLPNQKEVNRKISLICQEIIKIVAFWT